MTKLKRKSYRLKGFDYKNSGFYFITIVSYQRQNIFGRIMNKTFYPNELGHQISINWNLISEKHVNIEIDAFVVMPNHIHGILKINGDENFMGMSFLDEFAQFKYERNSIGQVIRGFKSSITSWSKNYSDLKNIWQRNYYDHIIRDEKSYNLIKEYILLNPENWTDDMFYGK